MTDDGYHLTSLPETELDALLGDALYAEDFGAKAPTDAEKIRRGQRWFASQLTEFRQVVCTHRIVDRYLEKKDSAERELFDAVVTALASLTGIPVPVSALAAKIVRFGVSNLCSGTTVSGQGS
jgi:hypothetical protein